MTKARLDGFQMLLLGSVFFIAIGVMMEITNPLGMTDFEEIYYAARSAAHHSDPYVPEQVAAVYKADNGSLPPDTGVSHTKRLIIFICSNLPTTLFLVAPLAALPWKIAAAIWMALIAAAFITACFLVWKIGADEAPRVYGGLLCLLLVNSGLFLCAGNTAGLVVSLSVIAVCCVLSDRFVMVGVVCLAIALAMKPHDAGAVWLYFLLVGGVHRKRALQSLALTAVIAAAAILWVSHAAPHWYQELHANLQAAMLPGGRDNPGPTTQGGRGIGMIISLQAILSLIRDNATFYNLASYILCAPLGALWCVKTLRSGFSTRMAWFGLAAISAIAMLPVYHRTYDARLLMLAVPACAMLWKERSAPGGAGLGQGALGRAGLGRLALLLTIAAIVLTGDIFWVVFFQIMHYSGPAVVFGMFPGPIALLAAGIFFLRIYLKLPAEPPVTSTLASSG